MLKARMTEIEKKITGLRDKIRKYNYHYYVKTDPIVSDFEYDKIYTELLELENKYPEYSNSESPTQRIGSDLTKSFPTVQHTVPMLSLSNTYNEEELLAFDKRIRKELTSDEQSKLRYVAELKIDGVSVSITYVNGKLFRAATRGDGIQGEEITANVKTIRSLPLQVLNTDEGVNIFSEFEVRGEIFMDVKGFKKLNEAREAAGEMVFKNPRNSTAGTVKLQDPRIVAGRPLDIYLYYLISPESNFDHHSDNLNYIGNLGFKVNPHNQVCSDINEVLNFCRLWEKKRHELSYEIDGVVVKVDNIAFQEKIGSIAKSPRWAAAFKFKAERKSTLLNRIIWQVGRTGAVTPVAELEPILLAGSTVSRATLHNMDEIIRKDIREGDTVFVEKGGDVIPKIVEVNLELRPEKSTTPEFPDLCPVCNTKLYKPENEVAIYCENTECNAQVKGRIIHFASRGAMDIEGLGEAIIDQLVDLGYLVTIADIYTLRRHKEALLELDRFGEKKVDNLLGAIEESKNRIFEKVLFGIGIRYVGAGAAAKIADHFLSMENLSSAAVDDIEEVSEVGPSISSSIVRFFENENNLQIIAALRDAGLRLEKAKTVVSSNKLVGKTFVLTGTLNSMTRERAKELVLKNGGKVVSSVSKKTDFVVAGENAGSKYDKAKKLRIAILEEEQFINMVGQSL